MCVCVCVCVCMCILVMGELDQLQVSTFEVYVGDEGRGGEGQRKKRGMN